MNKGIVRIISALAALVMLAGCGGITTQRPVDGGGTPILSASDAQAQIRVTVRPAASVVDQDTIVAAND